MIELTNVSKSYAGNGQKVVDGLTRTVADGKITGFFGPNGASKSTTLNMICGVHSIDEGTIKINGHDIATDGIEAKRQFGYVSDDPDRFLRLTGIEYLNFMADVYGTPAERPASQFEAEGGLGHIPSYLPGCRTLEAPKGMQTVRHSEGWPFGAHACLQPA